MSLRKISSKTHSRFEADKFSLCTFRQFFSVKKLLHTYFKVFSHDERRGDIKKKYSKACGFDNETTKLQVERVVNFYRHRRSATETRPANSLHCASVWRESRVINHSIHYFDYSYSVVVIFW